MNSDNRKAIVSILKSLETSHPNLRVGQIIVNAIRTDLFYISDEDLLQSLIRYQKEMK